MRRIKKIVADLKDFSHIDKPDVEEIDFNNMIEKVISVAWNELKYKTTVIKDFGDIPPVRCYGGQISQVFMNLIVNAAQAIPERGILHLSTEVGDNHITAKVRDTGTGIAEEDLDKIFDPFYTTKPVGEGTGLGLNISYNIIHAHGGTINVKSKLGEGTEFTIALPINFTQEEGGSN